MNFSFFSTTSKKYKQSKKLPPKFIYNNFADNTLIHDEKELFTAIQNLSIEKIVVADCEKKNDISLYDLVINSKFNHKVIDYKPNDLTMEAADLTLLKHFDFDVSNKNIGVYGTGNIAFKLALRLAERNVRVHLFGRNENKVITCIDALKQISFDQENIILGCNSSKLDALVSFVSADEVITSEFINLMKPNSLCLDGGIGNFSKEFISISLESGQDVRRLDVRQSQEILEGYINSRLNSHFDDIIGRDYINNHSVVAGGIIGQDGEVIVDRIVNPTKVIGIANGIGGVKDESTLSTEEQSRIQEVQSFIK